MIIFTPALLISMNKYAVYANLIFTLLACIETFYSTITTNCNFLVITHITYYVGMFFLLWIRTSLFYPLNDFVKKMTFFISLFLFVSLFLYSHFVDKSYYIAGACFINTDAPSEFNRFLLCLPTWILSTGTIWLYSIITIYKFRRSTMLLEKDTTQTTHIDTRLRVLYLILTSVSITFFLTCFEIGVAIMRIEFIELYYFITTVKYFDRIMASALGIKILVNLIKVHRNSGISKTKVTTKK